MNTHIKLEHGSGGVLTRDLIRDLIFKNLNNEWYTSLADASVLKVNGEIAYTTDSYVVDPLFFPGSDIGRLAVFGTCNDLAVSGAKPAYLSLAFILEQGLALEDLTKIVLSIKAAALEAGVHIVTGDTKVVPQGKGSGMYINTSGIGIKEFAYPLGPERIREHDAVIVSNAIGAHGVTVLAAREGLPIGKELKSDCAFLYPACQKLYGLGEKLRFLRDATRGGLAAVLNESVEAGSWGMLVQEELIPAREEVRHIAALLGLDLLEVANEGVFVAVVEAGAAEEAIRLLSAGSLGQQAAVIGTITAAYPGQVVLETALGGKRSVDFPRGLLLPRIC